MQSKTSFLIRDLIINMPLSPKIKKILSIKNILFILGSVALVTGIVARFLLLDISFEYDELFTAVTANPDVPFSYIWKHYLLVDVHPPLHNIFLWLYDHVVLYNGREWILRWPSVVFGLMGLLFA